MHIDVGADVIQYMISIMEYVFYSILGMIWIVDAIQIRYAEAVMMGLIGNSK